MKLDEFLNQLETLRIKCEESGDTLDDTLKFELIDLLVDYINNETIRNKVDEIPY